MLSEQNFWWVPFEWVLPWLWLFFCPHFLLMVFPLCSSDRKDHDSVVPLSGWVFGPNWPFFSLGFKLQGYDLGCPSVGCHPWPLQCMWWFYDFWGAGTQWEHLNPLQQRSLEASHFILLLFVLIKTCRKKKTLSPVILKFQNSLNTAGSDSLSCFLLTLCLSSPTYQCSALWILKWVPERCN